MVFYLFYISITHLGNKNSFAYIYMYICSFKKYWKVLKKLGSVVVFGKNNLNIKKLRKSKNESNNLQKKAYNLFFTTPGVVGEAKKRWVANGAANDRHTAVHGGWQVLYIHLLYLYEYKIHNMKWFMKPYRNH